VPQALWLAGLVLLAAVSLAYALHAVYLLVTRRPELNAWYGPASAAEELDAELAELRARGTSAQAMPAPAQTPLQR